MAEDKLHVHHWLSSTLSTPQESGWPGPMVDLKCPVCSHSYQHAGNPYRVTGDDYAVPWGGRGDLVVVPMNGECGHEWEVCFGFHKGNTAIFARSPKAANQVSPTHF